jgi:hypothetical protein
LPALGSFPARTLFLSRLSAPFLSFGSFSEPPDSSAPCWRTVATVYPLGNCDSLKPETLLSYLTRLGAVSFRTSSLSPFFACTDSARTLPEELVNSASAISPFGVFQLANPFGGLPESWAPCWRTVATIYPLGNCDSLRLETFLSYLTRLGTVSASSLAAQSLFRVY